MSTLLFRLGRFSFRHRWWVITAWVALLVVVGSLVATLQPTFAKDFELPGTDGGTATTQLEQYFPDLMEQQKRATTTVVVAAEDGLGAHTAELDALVADLRALPGTDRDTVVSPVTAAAAMPQAAASVLGDNGRVGVISVHQQIEVLDMKPEDKKALTEVLDRHRGGGLQVEATGGVMQAVEQGGKAELIGFAIAFVVMVVAFGALVAAFIPLVTGIVGVGLTTLLVSLSAEYFSINQSATGIITMLGIAVAIDYALFIVSRYRSEVKRGGSPADAAGRAVGTAGTAVVFAGLTVVVAVTALVVIGLPFVTQMGLGAALAVIIAVLAALTFIPALIGASGRFTFRPRIPWIRNAEESATAEPLGVRFGRAVVRRPVPFIAGALAILIAAAIPIKGMELGMDTTAEDEVTAQTLLARGFGQGVTGPLLAIVHTGTGTVDAAADTAVARIKALPGVAAPEALRWQPNGTPADTALIMITPQTAPAASETHDLVEEIRGLRGEIEAAGAGASIHVGGQTAILSDLSEKLDRALLPYLVVVVGLAFLIMIGVFRSLWVPLIGTIGFVFSVAATFGITTWIFTDGAFGLIGHTKPIVSFLPIFLIGVVFGLAMDYQVFLVTRMREEYRHGLSAREAIIAGYRHGARVVTSAAIIMISVFAAFMLAPETTTKTVGFALAIAVFFDAFLIRMIVVPATLALLGDRAWRLPAWLDKLVLDFDVEGGAVRNRGVPDAPEPRVAEPAPL